MDKLNTPRELRVLVILSQGDTITTINNNSWIVKSQTGVGEYQVCKKNKHWACTCPDFEKRQMDCKHIFAVRFSIKLKFDVEMEHKTVSVKVNDFRPVCPECKSNEIIKSGTRKISFDEVQRGLYSDETAEDFMDASRVYNNFLRSHMSLHGMTPAQAAGIDLGLGRNRWMSMIEQTVES